MSKKLTAYLRTNKLGKLRLYLYTLCVLSLLSTTAFAGNSCNETYTLPSNQWHQISLPCKPNDGRIRSLFGDDIHGKLGKDWAVMEYDPQAQSYRHLGVDHVLTQSKAYWIIQISGSTARLTLQGQSTTSSQTLPLATVPGSTGWNMVAYPFNQGQALGKTQVFTDTSGCASGCTLNEAGSKNLLHAELWHYNPASKKYIKVRDTWSPWWGYWAATIGQSHGSNPRLLIPSPSSLSIMLLGDSITQSNSTHYSYRYYLWKKLLDSGINFDFVGNMTNNNGGNPHWPDYLGQKFDPDHQAYWGLRADQVFDRLKHQNHRPSMALIHLGTNDEIQSQSTASTKNDLKNIVANLRNKNSRVIIFLAKILPYRSIQNPALNNSLASLVAELNTPNSPVILVDQNSGFNVNTDTFDRIHPNDNGERKMADRWYGAIMRKIN